MIIRERIIEILQNSVKKIDVGKPFKIDGGEQAADQILEAIKEKLPKIELFPNYWGKDKVIQMELAKKVGRNETIKEINDLLSQ